MVTRNVDIRILGKDRASKVFRKIAVAAGAFLSFRAIGRLVSSSTKAFIEQERVVAELEAALGNIGKASQIGQMQKFASQIQNVTVIGDETILGMQKLGVTIAGLAGKELEDATVAAVGLSKSLGIDVKSAMNLTARAAAGNTSTFSRYGVVFEKNSTAQERYNQVLELGNKGFAIARAEADTFGGSLQQLSNAWGDAKEQIGEYIANSPGFDKAIKVSTVVIQNFGLVMDIVWTKTALGLVSFWEDLKHVFTVRIPAVWNWFLDNWKEMFQTLFNFTKAIFDNMGKNISDFFTQVVSWLKGDGFNFEWTGLLEGFENTIKELPKIAGREMSAVESALAAELAESQRKLSIKITEKLTGGGGPSIAGQLGAGAALPGTIAGVATRGAAAAVESRFATGRNVNAAERIQAEQLQTQKQQLEETRELVGLMKAAGFGGTDIGIAIGRFKT